MIANAIKLINIFKKFKKGKKFCSLKGLLSFVKCFNKIFSLYASLAADSAKSRGFQARMIRNSHRSGSAIGIFSLKRNMISWPDNFKTKDLKCSNDLIFLSVNREFIQRIATSVSAIKASFGKPNFLITLRPKVSMWKRIADLVSARASSYVFPSPTTTPSNPNGYPIYPSSSLEITILNFFNKCILVPPILSIAQSGMNRQVVRSQKNHASKSCGNLEKYLKENRLLACLLWYIAYCANVMRATQNTLRCTNIEG